MSDVCGVCGFVEQDGQKMNPESLCVVLWRVEKGPISQDKPGLVRAEALALCSSSTAL